MIYWLLISLLFFIVVSYYFQNKDIMAPSVLLSVGYMISGMCCYWNIDNWGVDLHSNTVLLILIGVFCFIIGDFIAHSFSTIRKNNNTRKLEDTATDYISLPTTVFILFTVFNIVVFILSVLDMLRITGGWLQTIGSTIGTFRVSYAYTEARVNPWVVQLMKLSKGSSYTFLFIFMNNMYVGRRKGEKWFKKNIRCLLPIIIYILITLFRGGRSNLIVISVAALFFYYFIWHKQVGWKRSISGKFIKTILLVFVAFVVIFFITRTLVGRQSKLPFFDYITTYFGGSIELLDQYLNSSGGTYGHETFPGILSSLYKLGLSKQVVHSSLEFRYSSSGMQLGNIYTGLRRFYNDYGYPGVVILQMIYGFFMGNIYAKIKRIQTLTSKKLFLVVFYGTILHAPLIQAMEDTFWLGLSLGFIIEAMIIYICIKMILDYRLIDGRKIIKTKWHY